MLLIKTTLSASSEYLQMEIVIVNHRPSGHEYSARYVTAKIHYSSKSSKHISYPDLTLANIRPHSDTQQLLLNFVLRQFFHQIGKNANLLDQ